MRKINVADRSWDVDENGDDVVAGSQSGAGDPVTEAFVNYGYARI